LSVAKYPAAVCANSIFPLWYGDDAADDASGQDEAERDYDVIIITQINENIDSGL